MFNILLWQSKWRVGFGIVALLLTLLFIPENVTTRLWLGVGLGLLCPLLVLGRRRSLNREAYALILSALPRQRRWQLWGLTPSFFIVALWAIMIAQGSWQLGLIFLSWGVACVSLADFFDKRKVRLAEAWGWSLVFILTLGSAPFWGALFFGRTAFSPWVATLCISAHPVYTGLKSIGRHSLQDPLLYEITQSGLVEVHPLPWWSSTCFLLLLSALCWELTARSNIGESA
jgi:hypothetical protein